MATFFIGENQRIWLKPGTPNPTACYQIISFPMKKAINWAHTRHVQTIPNIWMSVIPSYIMLYPLPFKSNPVDIWAEKSVRRVCTIQRDTGSFSYKHEVPGRKKNDKMQVPTMDHFPDWSLKNAVLWISQFACLESIYLRKTQLETLMFILPTRPSYGDGSKPWYLVNPKIAGIYGCSSH